MIIKSKSIKTVKGVQKALYYILTGHNNREEGFVISHCIRGDRALSNQLQNIDKPEQKVELTEKRVENMYSQFVQNNENRLIKRENGNVAYHEIISFHKNDTDKLPVETLQKIARKYIQERSKNSLVVSTMHSDKDHPGSSCRSAAGRRRNSR